MTGWHEVDPAALEELRKVLRRRYPTLHVRVDVGTVWVTGTFAVLNEDAADDRYSISIELPRDYPRSLPSVWETAGRIERTIDRHVFPGTGALCLGVPIDLWIRLSGDFRVENYVEKAVRPYLIGNSLFEEGQPWPFDQSAHGSYGVLEFYQRLLGTDDAYVVARFLLALVQSRVRGHWDCPCGSGKALRKCHADAVAKLREVPRDMLGSSIDHMISILRARAAAEASKTPGEAA